MDANKQVYFEPYVAFNDSVITVSVAAMDYIICEKYWEYHC